MAQLLVMIGVPDGCISICSWAKAGSTERKFLTNRARKNFATGPVRRGYFSLGTAWRARSRARGLTGIILPKPGKIAAACAGRAFRSSWGPRTLVSQSSCSPRLRCLAAGASSQQTAGPIGVGRFAFSEYRPSYFRQRGFICREQAIHLMAFQNYFLPSLLGFLTLL